MASEKNSPSLFERFVPSLLLITVALAFMVGVLWQKVNTLEKGGTVAGNTTAGNQQAAAPAPVEVDMETVKSVWKEDVVKFGGDDKKLLIVEIADPSCPYCHVANGKNPELAKQIGATFQYKEDGGSYVPPVTEIRKLVDSGKASYAFIYFPGHGNGEMATKALYCAQEQGKYWEAHDLLYSNAGYDFVNNTLKNDKANSQIAADFLKGAVDAGKLKGCLDSGKYDDRLAKDQDLSAKLGVAGTPGFFINTQRFDGAYSWTDMQSAVDAALK
jgi:protein-disulfide isomerase